MSEHSRALEAAMKAGGFDPLNHVARKAVEDAVAAYLSELNTDPVGYVTKLELQKLRLGVGCVDLFGKVVPKGFEMVPVFAAPPAEATTGPTAEQERLRFEGELDKWMKIIGAGITGYQPEAYALMDMACEELVKKRAYFETAEDVFEYGEAQAPTHMIRKLHAARAALVPKGGGNG